MKLVCKDASNARGTGDGLLTEGKEYTILGPFGGYYRVICDDGKEYTKAKTRFIPKSEYRK